MLQFYRVYFLFPVFSWSGDSEYQGTETTNGQIVTATDCRHMKVTFVVGQTVEMKPSHRIASHCHSIHHKSHVRDGTLVLKLVGSCISSGGICGPSYRSSTFQCQFKMKCLDAEEVQL
jgi:hypothetical protein